MYEEFRGPIAEAVKVEVIVTRPDGKITRLVCEQFDYVEFERVQEPQSMYFGDPYDRLLPRETRSLSITLMRPKGWTIYAPEIQAQPSIDDGNVVEEG